jgi:hypothetical protein
VGELILHYQACGENIAPADLASVEEMIPCSGIMRSTGTRPAGTNETSLIWLVQNHGSTEASSEVAWAKAVLVLAHNLEFSRGS